MHSSEDHTQRWRIAIDRGRAAAQSLRLTLAHAGGQALGNTPFEQPGDSLEFMDYREYEPGDDIRRIDWRAFARSDRLVVKRHLREVSPHVEIIIDASASMALPETPKADAALAVAAALHAGSVAAGRTVRITRFIDQPLSVADVSTPFDRFPGFSSVAALSSLHPASPHGCTRILISDLMTTDQPASILRRLAQGAQAISIAHVLSQSDADPPTAGNHRLTDAETNQEIEVEIDETVRRRYHERYRAFIESIENACRLVGAVHSRVIAEQVWTSDALDLSTLVHDRLLQAG